MPTRTNKQMYCSFNFTKVNPKLFSSLHLSLNKIAFHFHTRRGAAPLCVESASSSTKVLNRDYGICAFLVQNFVTRIPRIWFRYEFIAQLKLLLCYCFLCSFCLYVLHVILIGYRVFYDVQISVLCLMLRELWSFDHVRGRD